MKKQNENNTPNNNLTNMSNGLLANLLMQSKTKSEDINIIQMFTKQHEEINKEYILKRVIPGLPDYKKHQIRLEKGERFAVRLQQIFDERKLNTVWNPNNTSKLNAIGNIQFCWKILKPTVPVPIANDWCPEYTTNEAREKYLKENHPEVFETKTQDLEYMLNWIFDIVVMLGLHNTKHGYSYINIKAIKEAFESHYEKIKTPKGLQTDSKEKSYIKISPFRSGFEKCNYMDCRVIREMEQYKINYVSTVKYLAETVTQVKYSPT